MTAGVELSLSPGAPLPPFGKPLGKLEQQDWASMVEKGMVQFGMFTL